MSNVITGWLFDVYPSAPGTTLWFIDREGIKHRCFARFTPSFYLYLSASGQKRAEDLGDRAPARTSFTRVSRKELFSGKWLDILQVTVHAPKRFREVVAFYERFFPHFAFFNSDIPVAQLFLYETQLFPLALGEYEVDGAGELKGWTVHDSREAVEYELPPLEIMVLRNANDFVPPKYQPQIQLEVSYEGKSYLFEHNSSLETLESLNGHLRRCDPDIILTEHGDATLLPKLTELARRHKFPLLLNRDASAGYVITRESSFFQYGQVIHKDGAFELAGRWHIDVGNSFTVAESELDGLFEIMRVTQMCPQKQARASIGTGLASLQLSWAHRNRVLIPSKKREPEEFKSAATLLMADRGGLIYQPPRGYHENIAELDFVSMYPSIMVKHNVSPETVNCRCCENSNVPELGYTLCERRDGIVRETLRMVLEKRAYYKKMKRRFKGKDEKLFLRYDRRQDALKWMLVTCFGYLGYKNARFGKIEAHEAVNAFSRETILRAKEIAEDRGFQLVHAIVDCVWLRKEQATERDYEELCRIISEQVGIDISLEGIYTWILFPSSKMDPVLATANRYVGWYRHGEMKVRGIEVRRRDTPKFIKKMQSEVLDRMAKAGNKRELERLFPELLGTAGGFIEDLQKGRVNPMELVLRRRVTKEADEYLNQSISAVVSNMLDGMGLHLAAGESIDFIIIDQSGKRGREKAKPLALYSFEDGYDIEKYTELALKALETLFLPMGYDFDRLKQFYNLLPQKRIPRPEGRQFDLFDSSAKPSLLKNCKVENENCRM